MNGAARPRCPACGAENVRFYRDGLPRYCNKSDCRKRAYYDRGINGRDVTATVDEAKEKRAKRLAYLSERIAQTNKVLERLQKERIDVALEVAGIGMGSLIDEWAVVYIRAYRDGTFQQRFGRQEDIADRHGLSRGAFQAILTGRNRPYLQDQAA